MKHNHGDIHPNGKWFWNSEVNRGKGDWRVIKKSNKTSDNEVKAEPKQKEQEPDKPAAEPTQEVEKLQFKTRKAFINATDYTLTDEEAQYYFDNFGNVVAEVVNTWTYYMGRIGSTSAQLFTVNKNGERSERGRALDKHPDWRPLAICHWGFRGYNKYHHMITICQSWDEIRKNLDDTENQVFKIVRHPHQ